MFCMQNRVLPVEMASFPTCMPIFTARIADPRPGRAPDPSRLFYEAEASTVELNQKTESNAAMQGAVPSLSLSKNPPTSGGAGS